MADLFTFGLTVPESMMHEVIKWSDQQNLGDLPPRIALFLAHVGNVANWAHVGEGSVDA
jgi:hypothetical protein